MLQLQDDSGYSFASVGLLIVASCLVAYYAHRAFEAPINLPETSIVPPRYMTPRGQYRNGQIAYTGLCVAIYVIITINYKFLFFVLRLILPNPLDIQNNSLTFPVAIITVAALIVNTLKLQHEANPLFWLRRLILNWVSIPALALYIIDGIIHHLVIPHDARSRIAQEPRIHVDVGDFDKDRRSLDRQWAEVSYLRFWLNSRLNDGRHNIFFNESGFRWRELDSRYELCCKQIIPLKQPPTRHEFGPSNLSEIVAMVEGLHRQYGNLTALLILYSNYSKKSALNEAYSLGALVELENVRANPIRYVVLFIVAILISIYLGAGLSVGLWDVTHPNSGDSFDQDLGIAARLVYYGLAAFGAPIVAVLMLRQMGWSHDAEEPTSYPISYATVFLVALCVSSAALALTLRFIDVLLITFWSPALICVYVVYHVDRQIGPLLSDIGASREKGIARRVLSCLLLGVLAILFSLLPAAALRAPPELPWPIDELRTVGLAATFMIGFGMALVAQFCLGRVRPTTQSFAMPANRSTYEPFGRPPAEPVIPSKPSAQTTETFPSSRELSAPSPNGIFISYSHSDEQWLERLKTALKPYLRGENIVVWDDHEIPAGSDWLAEIEQAIGSARIAVLLVSQKFLASDFIDRKEFPDLLKRRDEGMGFFWVPIEETGYKSTPLKDIQAAWHPDKPLIALSPAELSSAMNNIASQLAARKPNRGRSPR
jgi:TIR domain-containing protein